jgi:hypothetical protein
MEFEKVLRWAADHWGSILVALSLFIQWTPSIKWNPWTSLFKWVGNVINGDIRKTITSMAKAIDDNEKDRIRWEVLDFANSCRNDRRHSKDEFEHIVALNKKYNGLLKKTGDSNGVFEAEYEYINDLYKERLRKNDFL